MKSLNKSLRVLLVTNAMILMAGAMLGPIYAFFVEEVGGDLLDTSIAVGIFALVAGLTTLISGRYSDKIKENELIIVGGYSLMGLGFLLYLWVDSILFLFLVQAIIGFGEAIYLPAFDSIYSKHLDKNKFGAQWGMWELVNYFVGAIGAVAGGWLATLFGFQILFIIMATLCFFSAVYIYFLDRKTL